LLREVAKGVWAFSHLTIQEYLAARGLAERPDCEAIFCRAYFNPTLVEMEALPMALGLSKNPVKLYQSIEQLSESLNFAGLRLRARGLAYSAGIGDKLLEQLVARLVDFIGVVQIEEAAYLDAVIRSFSGIGGSYSNQLVEKVGQLLKSEDSNVRGRAAYSLGTIGGERAVAALLEALKDEYRDVRRHAAYSLGTFGGERAVAALLEALKDPESFVRGSAAYSLGTIGGERAVAALLEALKSEYRDVRGRAAAALEQVKVELLVRGLQSAMSNKNSFVRRKAAEVVGYYSIEQAHGELLRLAELDQDLVVRQVAENALAKLRVKMEYFGLAPDAGKAN
ncbi:MAG: HEAT repeat domain-containing protein, partial [Acidobacteria bacterium]|nr:HEAT repeat domain-containing protein [Acidobacteriota bacterium]